LKFWLFPAFADEGTREPVDPHAEVDIGAGIKTRATNGCDNLFVPELFEIA
jgi:hypothetical protein